MTDEVVEDPVFGTRYVFSTVRDDAGEESLQVEMWVAPGGGVPPHVHPEMQERFEVLEGSPEFLSGRDWVAPGQGEAVVVPAGTRHAFRNRGDETAHVMARATPPSTLQGFLIDSAAMSRAGMISRLGLPKSWSGMLAGAVLMDHYRPMVEMEKPPRFLQRLVIERLARVARRRGYTPGALGQ